MDVAIEATVGRDATGGIEHGDLLVAFGEAVTLGTDRVDSARSALREAMGHAATVEAAGIVGIFNGLVRVADFSGIPLDDDTLHGSTDFREALGLNAYAGAANSDLDGAGPPRASTGLLAPPTD